MDSLLLIGEVKECDDVKEINESRVILTHKLKYFNFFIFREY